MYILKNKIKITASFMKFIILQRVHPGRHNSNTYDNIKESIYVEFVIIMQEVLIHWFQIMLYFCSHLLGIGRSNFERPWPSRCPLKCPFGTSDAVCMHSVQRTYKGQPDVSEGRHINSDGPWGATL